VVVGAGVAGLVSAHLLAKAGIPVVVIEKADQIGGLAKSFVYDGFVFDCGPHRFHVENPNVKRYLDGVLGDRATRFPRRSEVYFEGQYYRWPLHPKNLVQLPPGLAARSLSDLALGGLRKYGNDTFEDYVLRQYGPTLYESFFRAYSEKFLGLHPRETHADWAKVGINRAIIDEKLEMQNLFQLARTTLTQSRQTEIDFVYPEGGLFRAWIEVAREIEALGGTIHTGAGAVLHGDDPGPTGKGHIVAVDAGGRRYEPSEVIWTAPLPLAAEQLELEVPDLDYLALLLFNVMVEDDSPRAYQWCYYGAPDIVFNRVSIPRYFCGSTAPPGMTGFCVEVTCRVGDERWVHAERLIDWVLDDLTKVGMIDGRRKVVDVRVERIRDSYPIYKRNYPEALEGARRDLARFENLHLAGRTGLFWYNNMDHSMENAMQLAKKLLRDRLGDRGSVGDRSTTQSARA
jgi:protoporphyrinogen oxidase